MDSTVAATAILVACMAGFVISLAAAAWIGAKALQVFVQTIAFLRLTADQLRPARAQPPTDHAYRPLPVDEDDVEPPSGWDDDLLHAAARANRPEPADFAIDRGYEPRNPESEDDDVSESPPRSDDVRGIYATNAGHAAGG